MRLIKGKLYRLKRDCSLFKDDYGFSTILEIDCLDEGGLVLMVEPSEDLRRYPAHQVIFKDLVGWIDLEVEDFELVEEQLEL
jgi:hypothetical protein